MLLGPRTLGQGAAVFLVFWDWSTTPFHELRGLRARPLSAKSAAVPKPAAIPTAAEIKGNASFTAFLLSDKILSGIGRPMGAVR